ncbi:hypothetical protein B9S53_26255 [Arthrospira sp. O9.13F]|nr:hypothetical protein B9S53_26255 [Arthrospira sp. O9.13F]
MALGATLTKNAKDIIPETITNPFERESSTDLRTLRYDASKLSASQIINARKLISPTHSIQESNPKYPAISETPPTFG